MTRFKAALLLAAVLSVFAPAGTAVAQGFPGQAPQQQQQQMVQLTDQNFPMMLQNLGYVPQEKFNVQGNRYWVIQTNQNGRIQLVTVDPIRTNGKMTGYWLIAPLGNQINAVQPPSSDALLNLLKVNHQIAPYFFSYVDQNRAFYLNYEQPYGDTNQTEFSNVINRFLNQINNTQPHWAFTLGGQGGNQIQNQPVNPPFQNNPQQFNPVPQGQAANVLNTSWTGNETLQGFGNLAFAFQANGQALMVDAAYPTANTAVQGSWLQNGNQVTLQFKDCVYQGTINGQVLSGTARYNNGSATWTFTVTKAS